MTDATRAVMWSILSDAFGGILHSVRATMPEATMTAGHSHNEAFPFRAFAEYSIGEQAVDLSLDVQVKDSHVHASGDIALDNGLIVRDLMHVDAGPDTSEELVIGRAREFARLRRLRFAHSRLRFWTEGHSLTTTRSHESEQPASPGAISADADLWIRQFTKQFELHVLDASRDLPPDASVSQSQMATARAIVATFLDSGMDPESVAVGGSTLAAILAQFLTATDMLL